MEPDRTLASRRTTVLQVPGIDASTDDHGRIETLLPGRTDRVSIDQRDTIIDTVVRPRPAIARLVPLGIGVALVCAAIVVVSFTGARPEAEATADPVAEAAIVEPVVTDAMPSTPPADTSPVITEDPVLQPAIDPKGASDREPTRRTNGTRVECADVRTRADAARERYAWQELLGHIGARECFQAEERRRLRTKAYMELGQFERCASSGENAADPEVRRWAQLCKRRRG